MSGVQAAGESPKPKVLVAVGLLAVSALVLVTFHPALGIGFFSDDPWFLEKAGLLKLPEYLAFYFDPRLQVFWYRPMYGILILLEYGLFRTGSEWYHATQVLLHLANCMLLFAVVFRWSQRWRLAFVSALTYGGLPPGNWAVFWISVQDPLATFFCLASLWFWIGYLQGKRKREYLLALGALGAALLSKETAVLFPVFLFFVDRVMSRQPARVRDLLGRYAGLGFMLVVYAAIESVVQRNGYFPQQQGYSVGPQIVNNLLTYMAAMLIPVRGAIPVHLWLAATIPLTILAAKSLNCRSSLRILAMLGIAVLFAIAPALGFPTRMYEPRYLYPVAIAFAVFLASTFESGWRQMFSLRHAVLVPIAIITVVLLSASSTAAKASDTVRATREGRVALRDIFQQHPVFPPDTYLYFSDGCLLRHFTGWFFLHYGPNVKVMCPDVQWGGVDILGATQNDFAGLHDHKNTFVYYYDDAKQRHEVPVDPIGPADSYPKIPVTFQKGIHLIGYEVTSTALRRDNALVLFLYWRATERVDRDYTVFVHLVNDHGQMLAGADVQPRNGFAPTTSWEPGNLIVDPHVLPISSDVPVGKDYHVEVGLYYLPSMERLGIVDSRGRTATDTLTIEPFRVVDSTAQ